MKESVVPKLLTVDVRIVAATNVSLEQAVANGDFRADLYYRLNVVPIILPSLRDRKEDIPLLFSHFLGQSNERNGREIKITSELLDFLISYSWPGNVREMQNLVERMVILAEGDRLGLSDLPPNLFAVERLKSEISKEDGEKVENRPADIYQEVTSGYRTDVKLKQHCVVMAGSRSGLPGNWD